MHARIHKQPAKGQVTWNSQYTHTHTNRYDSLRSTDDESVANARLLDLIRQVGWSVCMLRVSKLKHCCLVCIMTHLLTTEDLLME
jgi:hypothetical protein